MELFALVGFIVIVLAVVVGVNMYRRPDWTRRKIAQLTEKFK